MANKEKRPAEMETPTGTCTMTFPDYNMFTPEEQEKAVKAMELFWMVLQANGLNDRKAEITGTLPTIFCEYAGHISGILFRCYETGYKLSGECIENQLWMDVEKEEFLKTASHIKGWLHGILEGMKHDA